MAELGIDGGSFRSLASVSAESKAAVRVAGKPMFLFQGEAFESDADAKLLKSLLLDLLQGEPVDKVNLAGLDRVLVATALGEAKFALRLYAVVLKKGADKLPRVELAEAGPRLDLVLRRARPASDDLARQAMRQPRGSAAMPRREKNVEEGLFGSRVGRVHMQRQELADLALKKSRALKRGKDEAEGAGAGAGDGAEAGAEEEEAAASAAPSAAQRKRRRVQ
jgi:ribosome production factor 2